MIVHDCCSQLGILLYKPKAYLGLTNSTHTIQEKRFPFFSSVRTEMVSKCCEVKFTTCEESTRLSQRWKRWYLHNGGRSCQWGSSEVDHLQRRLIPSQMTK